MRSFTHDAPAQRIVFGAGTIATVSTELNRLNVTRAVVLSTPGQRHLAGRVADLLGERAVGQFHGAVPHTPVEVTEEALEFLRNRRGDAVVSVGGGSTTGLGKAVAHVWASSTWSFRRRTPVRNSRRCSGRPRRREDHAVRPIMPDSVIYDIQLTSTLPWSVTVPSAINAMAHAVEALYSPDANDHTDEMALQAVRSIDQGPAPCTTTRSTLAPNCSTGRIWRARLGAVLWACTTRCVMSSAARSPCRMRQRTPSCSVRHGLQRTSRTRGDEPDRRSLRQ